MPADEPTPRGAPAGVPKRQAAPPAAPHDRIQAGSQGPRRLVISSYVRGNGYSPEVIGLWLAHLRGPGRFGGEVLLFTDEPDDAAGLDLRVLPFGGPPASKIELYLQRVRNGLRAPVERYDSVLQMDLDMLAVRPLDDFFPVDGALWVSASGLAVLDRRHAGYFLRPVALGWERFLQRLRRRGDLGVSACLVAARGDCWRSHLSHWVTRIEDAARRGTAPGLPLGDQTVLNLIYLKRWLPIRIFPPDWIAHRHWAARPEARVLHFAGMKDRSDWMRKFAGGGAAAQPVRCSASLSWSTVSSASLRSRYSRRFET